MAPYLSSAVAPRGKLESLTLPQFHSEHPKRDIPHMITASPAQKSGMFLQECDSRHHSIPRVSVLDALRLPLLQFSPIWNVPFNGAGTFRIPVEGFVVALDAKRNQHQVRLAPVKGTPRMPVNLRHKNVRVARVSSAEGATWREYVVDDRVVVHIDSRVSRPVDARFDKFGLSKVPHQEPNDEKREDDKRNHHGVGFHPLASTKQNKTIRMR